MDTAAIERLVRVGGKKLAVEMIDIFFDYVPKIIAEARAALPANDLQTVARVGHSLRSSASNVGPDRLHALAQGLEEAARAAQVDQVNSLLPEVEAAFLRVRGVLAERRRELVA